MSEILGIPTPEPFLTEGSSENVSEIEVWTEEVSAQLDKMNSNKLIQPVGIPSRVVKELEYEIAKLSKLNVVITSHL